MQPLALIVAWARGRVIGKDGDLPWREPEDLAFFKRTTTGHAILMGRRTCESIGRPLPRRRNIVITRNADYTAEGCEVVTSVEAAIDMARTTDDCPFVIGGAGIYAAALPLVTRMYVTEIDRDVDGDTWFPEYDADAWRETSRNVIGELAFVTYDRAGVA